MEPLGTREMSSSYTRSGSTWMTTVIFRDESERGLHRALTSCEGLRGAREHRPACLLSLGPPSLRGWRHM